MDVHILTTNQVLLGFLVPMIIQILKKLQVRGLGWLQQNTPKACAAVSAVIALIATLGIHAHFDPSAHTLLITGLDPQAIVTGLLASASAQFATQHVAYESIWRHLIPTPNKSV